MDWKGPWCSEECFSLPKSESLPRVALLSSVVKDILQVVCNNCPQSKLKREATHSPGVIF